MAGLDAAARVRTRLSVWLEAQGRGSKKRLAEAVGARYGQTKGQAWVTGVLKGPEQNGQDLRLVDLDLVAEVMGIPPGDLVRREDRLYMELTQREAQLVRRYRALPAPVRDHWQAWLDYLFGFVEDAERRQQLQRQKTTERMRQFEARQARTPDEE